MGFFILLTPKFKYKRILNLVSSFIVISACFFGSYLAFKNKNLDFNSLEVIEGIVTNSGVGDSNSNISGRFKFKKSMYLISLDTSEVIFGVYKPDGDYSDLMKQITPGQFLRIYFKPQFVKNKPNLQTYLIESYDQVIMNSEDYRNREGIAGCIALFGGIVLTLITFYEDKKYW